MIYWFIWLYYTCDFVELFKNYTGENIVDIYDDDARDYEIDSSINEPEILNFK